MICTEYVPMLGIKSVCRNVGRDVRVELPAEFPLEAVQCTLARHSAFSWTVNLSSWKQALRWGGEGPSGSLDSFYGGFCAHKNHLWMWFDGKNCFGPAPFLRQVSKELSRFWRWAAAALWLLSSERRRGSIWSTCSSPTLCPSLPTYIWINLSRYNGYGYLSYTD